MTGPLGACSLLTPGAQLAAELIECETLDAMDSPEIQVEKQSKPTPAEYLASGSSTLVLLGAGASVKAGVPTSVRMTEVIAKAINDDSRNRYSGVSQALNFTIAAILAHRGEKGQSPYDGLDIEMLFSAVQMLATRQDLEVAAFVRNWHPALDSFGPPERPDPFIASKVDDSIRAVLSSARPPARIGLGKLLEQYVTASVQDSGTYPVYDELQKVMIRELRRQLVVADDKFDYLSPILNQQLHSSRTIATLNYDLGVECVAQRQGLDLTTGMENWAGGFDWDWPSSSALRLIKLHGSINWKMTDPDRRRHAASAVEVASGEESGRTLPLVIFGQRGKVRADGPFLGLLRAFEQALYQADRLLVVGYSFRDAHINTVINRWLVTDAARGIVVVDPNFNAGSGFYTEEFAPRLFQQFGRDQYPAEGGELQRLFIDPHYAEVALAELLP